MYNKSDVLEKYDDLLHKMAHKYYTDNPRFSYEDLVAQGQVAAMDAANSFDPNRGEATFMTFLYNAVDKEVKKFVNNNVFDLNVTEYGQRKEYKEKGNLDRLHTKNNAMRLDNKNGKDDFDGKWTIGNDFHDIIASGTMTPEESMIKAEAIGIMKEELYTLPERERHVVELRWLEGQTLQQIADNMNVSKQTIHGWEKKGFMKLQKRVKMRLGKELV